MTTTVCFLGPTFKTHLVKKCTVMILLAIKEKYSVVGLTHTKKSLVTGKFLLI